MFGGSYGSVCLLSFEGLVLLTHGYQCQLGRKLIRNNGRTLRRPVYTTCLFAQLRKTPVGFNGFATLTHQSSGVL